MKILLTGSTGYIGSKLKVELEKLGHVVFDRIHTKVEGIELIYHLAAQTSVQESIKHPLEDAYTNIILAIKILETYPDVRIIYPGSACAIDVKCPYGLSKRTAVDYIKLISNNYVICNLANIWGKGGHGVIDLFLAAPVCTIFGDGKQTRTITHVDDVVRGFIQAMTWPTGEYSLGGEVVSVNEIARRIGKPIVYEPKKPGEIFNSIIPNTTPDWKPEKML